MNSNMILSVAGFSVSYLAWRRCCLATVWNKTCHKGDLWPQSSLCIHVCLFACMKHYWLTFLGIDLCVRMIWWGVGCLHELMFLSKRQWIRTNAPFSPPRFKRAQHLSRKTVAKTRGFRGGIGWSNRPTEGGREWQRHTSGHQRQWLSPDSWMCKGTLHARICALRQYKEQSQSEPH